MPSAKTSLALFEQEYAAAVQHNKDKLMRKKFGKRFLKEIELIAKTNKVEISGGLDFEEKQPGITGYEQVKGTSMASPFFHETDYEMQFHTHVAYRMDKNTSSCHPSPADMGNVALFYPGVILWEGPGQRMHWILLLSAHEGFVTPQAMNAAYNKARKSASGSNTGKAFVKEWRAVLNRAGLDFREIKPGETWAWFPRDTHPEKRQNENKVASDQVMNRGRIPGLRRASGFVTWFLGTAAPKLNPKGFHACINCKYSDHVGGYCGLYHADVIQIETCDLWQVKSKKRTNAISMAQAETLIMVNPRVEEFNARNAKASIRVTYSKRAAKQFHKSDGILFNDLTQRQRDIIIRELTNEYMFEDDIYGTVREYYEGLRYQFTKIPPEKLPMSAWEYIEPDTSEAEDIEKHFERQTKIENSIIKNGYNDDYPITIGYSWHEKDNAYMISIAYGNHRIQAVRNLMARGILPPDFQIPVMVIFNNPQLRAKMGRKAESLRKQENKAAYEKINWVDIARDKWNSYIKQQLMAGQRMEGSQKEYSEQVKRSFIEAGYRIEGQFAIMGTPPGPTKEELQAQAKKQARKEEKAILDRLMDEYIARYGTKRITFDENGKLITWDEEIPITRAGFKKAIQKEKIDIAMLPSRNDYDYFMLTHDEP